MNDYELIREALRELYWIQNIDDDFILNDPKSAIAALDRLKLESMEERASYEAELSRGQWISVEDRLPDNARVVDITNGDWTDTDFYWPDRWDRRGVTHWAERKEPPEGDSDE